MSTQENDAFEYSTAVHCKLTITRPQAIAEKMQCDWWIKHINMYIRIFNVNFLRISKAGHIYNLQCAAFVVPKNITFYPHKCNKWVDRSPRVQVGTCTLGQKDRVDLNNRERYHCSEKLCADNMAGQTWQVQTTTPRTRTRLIARANIVVSI